jgi:hypothetical protein
MRKLERLLAALSVAVSVSVAALAQTSVTATVLGTITDATGAVLAGAEAALVSPALPR